MARILIEAIQNGEENLARDILMKCGSYGGIDSQTSRRDGTALFFCCSRGYFELAKLLLDRGASVASTDKNRATPLHGAVDNGHINVVKLLISHGANINAQTYRGDTPLHLAAYRGFGEITQCLMEAGADYRLINSNSFTAENEAKGRGHHDLCNYIRTAQNELHLAERTCQNFESMIQLDPPSHTSSTGYQTEEARKLNISSQQETKSQRDFDVEVRRKILECRSDMPLRSKSCDYSTDKLNNLSVISLDPPSNFAPNCDNVIHRAGLSQRHSTGRTDTTILLPCIDGTTVSQLSIRAGNLLSPLNTVLTPSAFSGSHISCTSHASGTNRPACTFSQLLYPLVSNNNTDVSRRPSTGSAGSCFSDLSAGTGSDTGSLFSTGSDGSGYFSDARQQEGELNDHQLLSNCLGDHSEEKDLVLLSLGVRNPPQQKHKRQLSTTSESAESSEFSDIYDSTLFSLTSMVAGSRSSSISGPSPASIAFGSSGGGKSCSTLTNLEFSESRPRLNRATSVNCSFPSPNITLKIRPDYNKSKSTEYRPTFPPDLEHSQLCPSFDRMTSNDLSSSFPLAEKPSCSMTCVNIPLN